MELREIELIVSLLDKDQELKQCYEEHQELEKKLQRYQHRAHLSSMEELEKKRLQKLKLLRKDRIMEILRRYRQAGTQR